ncbi:MAG: EAL domain-containing protein [Herbinix sp.]|nr:EAL domain-containing protein [Herbinix sp.]
MNFTLPKNRIAPLIIIATISIIVSFILGFYQLNRMIQYSYKVKLETYDTLTNDIASLLKQEIENNYRSLQVSANLVAKAGKLDKENIAALLPILSQNNSYIDIAIVGKDGTGYNMAGEPLDVSDESYYITAKSGKINTSNQITYTQDKVPVIIFAAPIIGDGTYKGALLINIKAQITDLVPFQSQIEEGSLIYVINENNDLISFMKDTDIKNFSYKELVTIGYLRKEAENTLPVININDFYNQEDIQDNTYIWYEKPLGINNWSVLIGRLDIINPITKEVLRLTNMMWIFISVSMLLFFILIIIIQRRSNRKVIKMLYLDPVTGGDNWYKFRIIVNKILSGKQFGKKKYALINFDINRFKIINDAYGYQKGDEVLKEIYNVIKKWVKPGEPFTRYAADQFYILLSLQEEIGVTERILELNHRLHQLRYTTTSKISYGVYNITECMDSIDRMGEFASIAKKNNKSNAEGMITFFDDAARARLLEEEQIENSMSDALKNNEFHVYLQPKYTAKEEKISGAEALVRWYNSKGDIVSPGYFIPVFEKNGFITQLDFYMLKKVCQLLRSWIDKGYTPLPISVNISRLHFANHHLAEIINAIVDDYKIPHNLIELEVTESAFLQDKQMLIEAVIRLRSNGFMVSMDDFGAGYSSLNSLKDLPLDVVKLDGELFRITNEVERGLTVIRNTITMAKDLHMKVVAECIETREQVEYLSMVGCDIIQGYYFAKPMPTDQFEQKYYL